MSETPQTVDASRLDARGLDTNVLARYLVGDDPIQYDAARAYIEDELTPDAPGLVHPVALCELVWVLRQVYSVPKPEIANALRVLLSVRTLRVLGEPAVRDALALYEAHSADFADALLSVVYTAAGTGLATFDRAAARLPNARRLGEADPPLKDLQGSVPAEGGRDPNSIRE